MTGRKEGATGWVSLAGRMGGRKGVFGMTGQRVLLTGLKGGCHWQGGGYYWQKGGCQWQDKGCYWQG